MRRTAVAVVSWGSGRLDIFALGRDDQMFHKAWDGRWHPSPTTWGAAGWAVRLAMTVPLLGSMSVPGDTAQERRL
jgi:hypothetical protein